MARNWKFDPQEQIDYTIEWIKKYFVKNAGSDTKAIVGISGGKDSTIAAALLVRALGAERVHGVLMPCGNQADIAHSYEICNALGIKYDEINIEPAVDAFYGCIGRGDCEIPAVRTNVPARMRMVTLYAIAAIYGGRVVNTGNWSEGWIGYTTKYGDLAGDFHLFQDLTVREVLMMGRVMKEIPSHLVDKAPADGMTGQTDEDNMGVTYEQIDAFLLEDILPDINTWRNMSQRHERNEHKKCINLPGPFAHGRHYEKGKHGGVFEVF